MVIMTLCVFVETDTPCEKTGNVTARCSACNKELPCVPREVLPNVRAMCGPAPNLARPGGTCYAGTELKKLFALVGIKDEAGCKCTSHAAKMDRMGCNWCENNLDTIVEWLVTEAKRRRLPYVRQVLRATVRLAIRRARKNETLHNRDRAPLGQ